MCLIGLALDAHPRLAFVIAANRDEFFDRPTAPLDWWRAHDDGPWLLAGRDLAAGGTWLGLADNGRFAALTNLRDPSRHRADASSRGAHVTAWLGGREPTPGSNAYNLIGGDLLRSQWHWRGDAAQAPLAPGVHTLSNAALGTPWPKARRLAQVLGQALDSADTTLTEHLFDALADRRTAPDAELPDTGVGLERERWLSSAFIVAPPEARYGTRCSTVIVGERAGPLWRIAMTERSFDTRGTPTLQRSVVLDAWPARDERPAVRETRL